MKHSLYWDNDGLLFKQARHVDEEMLGQYANVMHYLVVCSLLYGDLHDDIVKEGMQPMLVSFSG